MPSDAGPKTVLIAGMVMFAVSFVVFAIVPSAEWLVVPRLPGRGDGGDLPLGSRTRRRRRAVTAAAIGLHSPMGSGSPRPAPRQQVGHSTFPQALAAPWSPLRCVFGVFRLSDRTRIRELIARHDPKLLGRALAREPRMIMACVANMAMTLSMTGAIFTYFPVYARGVGVSTVTIGALFAWRSLASATGRIPVGALSSRIPAGWTLAAVLLVEAAVDVAIVHTASDVALGALLILEGVIFGIFLVSGQAAVAAASGATNRGAAVGMFWMAGSVGDFLGPLALGVVAGVRADRGLRERGGPTSRSARVWSRS
jgi:MFS family permease